MPKCTEQKLDFGRLGRRVIEADFSGGDLSSEGGAVLLRRMDQRLGLTAAAARALGDARQPGKVEHSMASMVARSMTPARCISCAASRRAAAASALASRRRPSAVRSTRS